MKVLCGLLVYNEERNLPRLLEDFPMAFKRRIENYQILAVNDGSSDQSESILREASSTLPLAVTTHSQKLGIAASFRDLLAQALQAASDDVFVLMEADGTCSPFCVPFMAEKIKNGADMVICSRFRLGGGVERFPWFRKWGSAMINTFLSQALPYPNLSDYTIFFRAYRIGFLQKLTASYKENLLTQSGFAANGELLLKSLRLKPVIEEMPYLYPYSRKESKSQFTILPTCYQYLLIFSNLIFATP